MRPGMDTETVALLPVLRRIESTVDSNGTAGALAGNVSVILLIT